MEVLQDFSVLDALTDAVVVIDPDGRITSANAATARLLGTTTEALVGRSVFDASWGAVGEDGLPFPMDEHPAAVAMRTGRPAANAVLGIPTPGRPVLWLLVSASPLPPGPSGAVHQAIVSARDITEWRADRARAAGLARFYAIRAATGQAVARVADRRQLLQAVCQAALTEGNLSMAWIGFADASGRVQPEAWAGVEVGYLEKVKVSLDARLPEGRGPSGRAMRSGRREVCADIATDATMSPWRDEALGRGYRSSAAIPLKAAGAVGVFSVYAGEVDAFDVLELDLLEGVAEDLSFALEARDAAGREQAAREQVKASEARFRELLESAPDAMVIADAGGEIILVNRQTEVMFGYDRGQLIGQPVETLIPGRLRATHRHHRAGFFTNHPVARPMGTSLELHALRADGTEFPVEISLSPIRTDSGLWVSAAVRDITERKRAEDIVLAALRRERELTERLRELDRMKGDFVSTVSHELRTPLTSIISSIDLLTEPDYGALSVEQRRFVDILERNSRRLQDLVEDLLQLNQIDTGGFALHPRVTDLAQLLQRVYQDMEPIAHAKGVDLLLDLPPGLGNAVLDARHVARAMENLLTNAIKFTPAGGTVTLHASRTATEVVLVVSDTGLGIPEQEQQRLFTRFFRSSIATSKAIPGTGLGLVIVKGIVDAHSGTLQVDSTLGVGTTVTMSLPLARRVAA